MLDVVFLQREAIFSDTGFADVFCYAKTVINTALHGVLLLMFFFTQILFCFAK